MINFQYANKKYRNVPENYNELTSDQLLEIAELFVNDRSADEQRLHVLKVLLNRSLTGFMLIPSEARLRMLPYTDWVFEKNKLTKQLLPRYDGFVGAKEEFDNLTIGEFHFTEKHYRELVTGNRDLAISSLVAVLYRREKSDYNYELDSDGDARIKFNPNEVPYYASIISKWPQKVKLAILFFYDGCRQNLLESYEEVFQGDSGEENEEGMFGVIRGLSGDKYGDMDKVELLNIHTALLEISLQIKEAAAIKSQMATT